MSTCDERTATRNCPLCSGGEADLLPREADHERWRLHRCRSCRFVYLGNPPTHAQLASEFAWSATRQSEGDRKLLREPMLISFDRWNRYMRKRLLGRRDKGVDLMRAFVGRGRFLDIGCGKGNYIRKLAPDLRGSGIEIDPQAAAMAGRHADPLGERIFNCDSLTALREIPARSLDGVLMRGYLEHETSPRPVLEHVARVLRPGGRAVIQVPNYGCVNRHVRGVRWCGFRFPEHVNYFEPRSLKQMVLEAGLDIVRFWIRDRLPLSDRMWMVAGVRRHVGGVTASAGGPAHRVAAAPCES
jgi:SAM-dependent methyltransferase